jgi:precorrin-6Y C5,15-methyltransferase (decarboxylating)
LVVSAHGRELDPAIDAVLHHPKVAVLVSPDNPPEVLGSRLAARACPDRLVAVVSRIGEPDELTWQGDIAGLAEGRFDPNSVVILRAPSLLETSGMTWAWGRADEEFSHRNGMITKSEVRAVALGRLNLPAAGVLWDVGAGSGSVSAECAALSPGLRVYAIERQPANITRIRNNLAGTSALIVRGQAPAVLDELPDPDRVFVGGGGIETLDACLKRLRSGGTVVAVYVALDRAVQAAERLGHIVQVSVSRGAPIGDTIRLSAENPVFICWGPEP